MVVSSSSRSIHCLISLCFSSFSLMDDDVMIALFIFSRIFSKTRRSDTEAMSPFRGFSWRNLRTLLWQIKQESLKSCWKKLKFYSRSTSFCVLKTKEKKIIRRNNLVVSHFVKYCAPCCVWNYKCDTLAKMYENCFNAFLNYN